jgi:RHH-type proline utilization regulon transcriptional repressor/proline dehydrogenase/delta 1-pyrroline-5-carboxylate dehydrogenase
LETETALCEWIRSEGKGVERIRALNPSEALRQAACEAEAEITDWSVLANGRIELLHYLREQVVSETRHRYGNIMARS